MRRLKRCRRASKKHDDEFDMTSLALALSIAWVVLPPGFTANICACIMLGAMDFSLVPPALCNGLRPAPAVARLPFDHDSSAGPRNGAW